MVHETSIGNSCFVKNISLQLFGVKDQVEKLDELGETMLARITELMDAQQMSKAQFGRAIRRGTSWISEFFNRIRTTNDLRLVLRIAKVFGVPCGYLLGESPQNHDAETLTLLAAWRGLADPADRDAVKNLALALRKRMTPSAGSAPANGPSESPAGVTRGHPRGADKRSAKR